MRRETSASVYGGRAEGLACADLGARTPIGASGNFLHIMYTLCSYSHVYAMQVLCLFQTQLSSLFHLFLF